MTQQVLLAEYQREMATTRRLLERIPRERLDWRPHPKSFTVGGLGAHLVDCVRWVNAICLGDEFDIDPSTFRPYAATSVEKLLTAFDEAVDAGRRALSSADASTLATPWRLTVRGRLRVERPRGDAVRDFTLSHGIHHRGQLSVYLRLLDVPVPAVYGPTADEPVSF